uniref:Uncharacterized protein n=1 Tax=Aegilops tauschii subsp. strangulata TaxID=200361 RepID=A0A453SID9_AEGTS
QTHGRRSRDGRRRCHPRAAGRGGAVSGGVVLRRHLGDPRRGGLLPRGPQLGPRGRRSLLLRQHGSRRRWPRSGTPDPASRFASVLLTTRHDTIDDLLHTGELALCSVVLMFRLIIILSSAAKITHQAQALTGQTTKWHACWLLHYRAGPGR